MRLVWCWLCYHIAVNWPFNTARSNLAYKGLLWFLPWAGEWAYKDDGPPLR